MPTKRKSSGNGLTTQPKPWPDSQTISAAKKAGLTKVQAKKPTKPKSKNLDVLNNWVANTWNPRVKLIYDRAAQHAENIKNAAKAQKAKATISGL